MEKTDIKVLIFFGIEPKIFFAVPVFPPTSKPNISAGLAVPSLLVTTSLKWN